MKFTTLIISCVQSSGIQCIYNFVWQSPPCISLTPYFISQNNIFPLFYFFYVVFMIMKKKSFIKGKLVLVLSLGLTHFIWNLQRSWNRTFARFFVDGYLVCFPHFNIVSNTAITSSSPLYIALAFLEESVFPYTILTYCTKVLMGVRAC